MVRIINIDTKTRTIRVSNEDKDIDWITVKGTHVPIKKGESKGEAVEKFFEDKGRKFYRGSVVHKDTIDGLKKAKDKHSETMKYWESEGKKNHKEKGYADFVKKEIEAQKQYAKRLHESIADISRDCEIDPEDIGMNKEFDDWKKSKQPAKKSAAQIFKDAGDDTGWKSIKSGSHHQFFDENNWAQREHEYVYLPDGDDSFDNYARIEKDTDGDPRVVVTLVKDGERVYKDPFDGYDDQAGNMQAAIEAVARAFGK